MTSPNGHFPNNISLGVRISAHEFGGIQTFRPQQTPSSKFYLDIVIYRVLFEVQRITQKVCRLISVFKEFLISRKKSVQINPYHHQQKLPKEHSSRKHLYETGDRDGHWRFSLWSFHFVHNSHICQTLCKVQVLPPFSLTLFWKQSHQGLREAEFICWSEN